MKPFCIKTLGIVAITAAFTSNAWAYNSPPRIKNVAVDYELNKIVIVGSGLLRANGRAPRVRLLDNPNIVLQNCEADANTPNRIIVCDLPELSATNYVLRVSDGYFVDSFDLSIGQGGSSGQQGEPGPAGPQGPQGEQGATGPQGPQGEQGPAGPQGLTGLIGATGAQGPAGPVGTTGAAGAQGPAGPIGVTGPAGAQGPAGPIGATGAQGPAGPIGVTGAVGPQGPAGAVGATGPAGPQGESGDSVLQTLANDPTICPTGSLLRLLAEDDGSASWRCISVADLRTALAGRIVFATSERYTGDLVSEANNRLATNFTNIQSLEAGDALCQARADATGLDGSFNAWLSLVPTGTNDAFTRTADNTSGYVLADRSTFIADNKTDLTDGTISAPINRDETGALVNTGGLEWTVWTNTSVFGTEGSGGGFNCQEFTSSDSSGLGVVGDVRAVGNGTGAPQGSWSRANNLPCNQSARLFCFQR